MESFDGNVLNDHYLIALFMRAAKSKVEGFLGKLLQLTKSFMGNARDLIKHCIQLTPN